MLDAFIIEQIRKREERAREQQRPFLELPLPSQPRPENGDEAPQKREEEPDRGVIVIDFA